MEKIVIIYDPITNMYEIHVDGSYVESVPNVDFIDNIFDLSASWSVLVLKLDQKAENTFEIFYEESFVSAGTKDGVELFRKTQYGIYINGELTEDDDSIVNSIAEALNYQEKRFNFDLYEV